MSKLTTEERVHIGAVARQYIAFALGELEPISGEGTIQFWEAVLDEARRHLPQKEEEAKKIMTTERAKTFERQSMPFGKYSGATIGMLDTSYLTNIVDPSPFMEELRQYVRWRIDNGF